MQQPARATTRGENRRPNRRSELPRPPRLPPSRQKRQQACARALDLRACPRALDPRDPSNSLPRATTRGENRCPIGWQDSLARRSCHKHGKSPGEHALGLLARGTPCTVRTRPREPAPADTHKQALNHPFAKPPAGMPSGSWPGGPHAPVPAVRPRRPAACDRQAGHARLLGQLRQLQPLGGTLRSRTGRQHAAAHALADAAAQPARGRGLAGALAAPHQDERHRPLPAQRLDRHVVDDPGDLLAGRTLAMKSRTTGSATSASGSATWASRSASIIRQRSVLGTTRRCMASLRRIAQISREMQGLALAKTGIEEDLGIMAGLFRGVRREEIP
jgi:hypothetical protein